MSSLLVFQLASMLLFSFSRFPFASATPLVPRIPTTTQPLDPGTDEWSSTLSSISPLVLLIGERTTKQVLRNIRSPSQAFSLASAPLGLLSIVTCLIRFCGIKELRAWIGYELEARNVVGLEVCRVNCGGVTAHLSGGWVDRSTVGDLASRLIGVAFLDGEQLALTATALRRISACDEFERDRKRRGIPDGVVGVEWVMHIISKDGGEQTTKFILDALADAIRIPKQGVKPSDFHKKLNFRLLNQDLQETAQKAEPSSPRDTILEVVDSEKARQNPKIKGKTLTRDDIKVSSLEIIPTLSDANDVEKVSSDSPIKFTFMSTFDAVSEFTANTPTSNKSSIVVGLLSFLGILIIHIIELWNEHWVVSIGWILMIAGYIGIVLSVTCAALLIHRSCICIKLDTTDTAGTGSWREGMVVSVKNTDSMDTTGSDFVASSSRHQNFEAVWIKSSTHQERLLASGVAASLVLAFISHYLGLRAMKWWASVAELCICLLASFARSVSNDHQRRFKVVEGVKVDKRCMSTGVIHTQTARLITHESNETSRTLDVRAYSLRSHKQSPTVGERVAFRTAKLVLDSPQVYKDLAKLTGMTVNITSQERHQRAILLSFSGGILLSEGVGFPEAVLCIAFQASTSNLASPTALLARSLMRQPTWRLTHPSFGKGIPLGNVYIFSIQSMMEWWTLSEDRNDMGDLQKNLHWPLLLVNIAFFVELLRSGDEEMIEELAGCYLDDGNETTTAEELVEFLKTGF